MITTHQHYLIDFGSELISSLILSDYYFEYKLLNEEVEIQTFILNIVMWREISSYTFFSHTQKCTKLRFFGKCKVWSLNIWLMGLSGAWYINYFQEKCKLEQLQQRFTNANTDFDSKSKTLHDHNKVLPGLKKSVDKMETELQTVNTDYTDLQKRVGQQRTSYEETRNAQNANKSKGKVYF